LAIAAVTATFIRYISSVLAGVIYLFVVFIIAGYNWGDSLGAPYVIYYISIALLLMLLAALVIQYAKRKTLFARLLLIALPLVFVVFALLTPVNLFSEHRYPDVSVGKVTFDPDPNRRPPSEGKLLTFEHKNVVQIPVQVEFPGMSDENFVAVQRVRITIDGPNGFHYASNWIGDDASLYAGGRPPVVPVAVPADVFDKIHDKPVAMHLELGTQTYHAGTPYTVTATEQPFPIPGNATCIVSADNGGLECRFPFRNPEFVQVAAIVHNGNCGNPGPLQAPAEAALLPSAMLPAHFSPVDIVNTTLQFGETKVPLCPGSQATFRSAVAGEYGRMHLDIPAITLDAYAFRLNPNARRPQQPPPQQ
jgi:hypothetical protein